MISNSHSSNINYKITSTALTIFMIRRNVIPPSETDSKRCTVNKYVGPPYCRAEIYAGHISCCPLVSYGEYVNKTDRQRDRRHTVTLLFLLDAASIITCNRTLCNETLLSTHADRQGVDISFTVFLCFCVCI